jgi:hypothetical protein
MPPVHLKGLSAPHIDLQVPASSDSHLTAEERQIVRDTARKLSLKPTALELSTQEIQRALCDFIGHRIDERAIAYMTTTAAAILAKHGIEGRVEITALEDGRISATVHYTQELDSWPF